MFYVYFFTRISFFDVLNHLNALKHPYDGLLWKKYHDNFYVIKMYFDVLLDVLLEPLGDVLFIAQEVVEAYW